MSLVFAAASRTVRDEPWLDINGQSTVLETGCAVPCLRPCLPF